MNRCSICVHPNIVDIDKALIEGIPVAVIAERYPGVRPNVLYTHKSRGHILKQVIKASEVREVTNGDTLLDHLQDLQARTLTLLATAEKAGDTRTAFYGISQARGNLELLAKLLGKLQEQNQTNIQVNVLMTQDWQNLRSVVLEVLEPYPDARLALVERLERLETNT